MSKDIIKSATIQCCLAIDIAKKEAVAVPIYGE